MMLLLLSKYHFKASSIIRPGVYLLYASRKIRVNASWAAYLLVSVCSSGSRTRPLTGPVPVRPPEPPQ